jgi:hypothetical protein
MGSAVTSQINNLQQNLKTYATPKYIPAKTKLEIHKIAMWKSHVNVNKYHYIIYDERFPDASVFISFVV